MHCTLTSCGRRSTGGRSEALVARCVFLLTSGAIMRQMSVSILDRRTMDKCRYRRRCQRRRNRSLTVIGIRQMVPRSAGAISCCIVSSGCCSARFQLMKTALRNNAATIKVWPPARTWPSSFLGSALPPSITWSFTLQSTFRLRFSLRPTPDCHWCLADIVVEAQVNRLGWRNT